MALDRLRVSLDANVLIAGVRVPRWPYEVLIAALRGAFHLALPSQVLIEARRHLPHPLQAAALQSFLEGSAYEEITMTSASLVREHLDLVRSEKDVPIALALLEGGIHIFVTSDRDFTDPGATADRLQARVRIMLPAVFLRDVLGWSSEALEEIRNRRWEDLGDAGRFGPAEGEIP
jgi:hypothetical protein